MRDLISIGMGQSEAASIAADAVALKTTKEALMGWVLKIAALYASSGCVEMGYEDMLSSIDMDTRTYSKMCKMGVLSTSESGVKFNGFGPLHGVISLLTNNRLHEDDSSYLSSSDVDRLYTMGQSGANGKQVMTNVTKSYSCQAQKFVVPSIQQAEVGYIYNKEYIIDINTIDNNKEEYIYKYACIDVGDKGVQGEKNLENLGNIPHCEKKNGRRIPDDWAPSQNDISFCLQKRPDLNPSELADDFRDYWSSKTGASATKLDWSATWRNWVRNQKRNAAPKFVADRRHEAIAKLTGAENEQPDAWTIES